MKIKKPAVQSTKEAASMPTLDLEAQHKYVQSLKKTGERSFQLIATSAFVESMRDSGYKSTATAVDEFVDNADQAGATRVDLLYQVVNGDGNQHDIGAIAVVDDGHGMEPDMIRAAVLWGGTHRHNDRSGLGRFGFGLPSAAVSITRRFEVYSKVKGGEWYRVCVDLNDVCAGKHTNNEGLVIAPDSEKATLPAWVQKSLGKRTLDQGTVVLLVAPDRLTTGFRKPNAFHRNMMEHFGLIYRGILNRCALFVGDQRVDAVDPLFLDPSARFYDVGNDVIAEGREPLQFAMKNGRTGAEGIVRLRFSYMPPTFQRNADGTENKERLSIMKENNAYFIVTRAGRQIDLVTRTAYPKDDLNTGNLNIFDRNWAIELDFDPILDEEFGITVNKQQVNLSERTWQALMDNGVPGIVKNDLRAKFAKARDDKKAKADENAPKQSEKVMAEAEKFAKKRPQLPDSKLEQARKKIEAEAEKEAKEKDKPKAEVEKKLLEEAHANKYVVLFEALEGAPFYRPDMFGPQTQVRINTRHRFYSEVYDGLKTMPRVRAAVELLLFTLAAEELTADGNRELFYKQERKQWSDRLELLLQLLDRKSSLEEEQSAEAESKEVA
ncbi:MAG TPA: ATP-binding protein [Verrucomicrobiae bacterium]|nr:ATP-binding protein [Verrucomicrobiae bacterium]